MGGQTEVVLHLDSVSKHFGAVVAVDDVDLTVQRGEVLTLLGPSGSGKTTILNMIAGFERPTRGRVLLEGIDAAPMSPAERRIGFVFQHHALFPHMTVGDNIRYPLKRRRWSRQRQARRVEEMLSLIQLPGYQNRYPRQLSGGQQQRIALARALAFQPRFLLMDEPLGALDRALRYELAEEIRRIHRETGATMVYVTHDKEEALTLSERIAVMRRGRIVQAGTPQALFEGPVESFIAEFLGECNLLPVDSWAMKAAGRAEVVSMGQGIEVVVPGDPARSDEMTLVMRPQQLKLNPESPDFTIQAKVMELLYLGEIVRIRLRCEPDLELLSRVEARESRGVQIGDEVAAGFRAEDAVLVPRTEPPTVQELGVGAGDEDGNV